MLAVTAISNKPTAANSSRIAARTSAVIASIAGVTVMSDGAVLPNIATAVMPGSGADRAREVASADACCGVAPGANRASTPKSSR